MVSNVILDEFGVEDIGYGMRGCVIYKVDKKWIMQVFIIENEEIDKFMKFFIQEVILDGDIKIEESGKGLQYFNNFKFVGYGNKVAVISNLLIRK